MWYSSAWVWHSLLSTTIETPFPLILLQMSGLHYSQQNPIVYKCHLLFNQVFVDRHPGWFFSLITVTSSNKIKAQVFLRCTGLVYHRHAGVCVGGGGREREKEGIYRSNEDMLIPDNGRSASYRSSTFNVLRSIHALSTVSTPVCMS